MYCGSVQHNNLFYYSCTRASFMKKLQELLDDCAEFELPDNAEKSFYVLGI